MTPHGLDAMSIAQLQALQETGEISACDLAEHHLERIEAVDGVHNAVIERNPDALELAQALDRERDEKGVRGPLHGIPIMLKDNIDTGDRMQTTAGSLALAGTRAEQDAPLVSRLRASGALIIGKTNLSEWANFRSTRSSSGWSSRGGQTRNAYDPARTPGGSSSGSAVAVALGLCSAAIGTETDGSIVGPAAMNGIVGIKPSVGLISRAGVIPISSSQDTAGPMARSVEDAALVMSVLVASDPMDPSTSRAGDYLAELQLATDAQSLTGARLGIAASYTGYHDRLDACFDDAVNALRAAGAIVVDGVDVPKMECIRPSEQIVMETEFRAGLETYLASRTGSLSIRTLNDLMQFNRNNAARVMPHFGQEILESCEARGTVQDAQYLRARALSIELAATQGIDAALQEHQLDAIIAPTTTPAWLIDWINGDNRRGSAACPPAVAGYPHVTVPMGFVEHLPVGLSFIVGAYQDANAIRLANAYERQVRGPLHKPRAESQ